MTRSADDRTTVFLADPVEYNGETVRWVDIEPPRLAHLERMPLPWSDLATVIVRLHHVLCHPPGIAQALSNVDKARVSEAFTRKVETAPATVRQVLGQWANVDGCVRASLAAARATAETRTTMNEPTKPTNVSVSLHQFPRITLRDDFVQTLRHLDAQAAHFGQTLRRIGVDTGSSPTFQQLLRRLQNG